MAQEYGLNVDFIVKPFGPFEVEVLRSISKLNAPSRLVCLG